MVDWRGKQRNHREAIAVVKGERSILSFLSLCDSSSFLSLSLPEGMQSDGTIGARHLAPILALLPLTYGLYKLLKLSNVSGSISKWA